MPLCILFQLRHSSGPDTLPRSPHTYLLCDKWMKKEGVRATLGLQHQLFLPLWPLPPFTLLAPPTCPNSHNGHRPHHHHTITLIISIIIFARSPYCPQKLFLSFLRYFFSGNFLLFGSCPICTHLDFRKSGWRYLTNLVHTADPHFHNVILIKLNWSQSSKSSSANGTLDLQCTWF